MVCVRINMSTHPVATPTIRRCFSLTPPLDLWMMDFCHRNDIRRSDFVRQAIKDALLKHDPHGKPVASMGAILARRFSEIENDGRHGKKLEFRDTGQYKAHKRGRITRLDRRLVNFI